MASKKRYTHAFGRQAKVLYRFCWFLSAPFLRIFFRVRFHGVQQVNADKRGCMLIANHQSNVDPFLINTPLTRQVQYFVSDSNMRSAIGKSIFWLLGGIAKSKFMQDFQSMRKAVSVVKGGGIVGIFPEGLASWDGNSLEIIDATAKLVKFLRVSVYNAHICGSYFTLPRWGNGRVRGGRVDVTYRLLLTPQRIKQLTVPQICAEIQQAVCVRAQEWQRERHYAYRSRRRAEYAERFLFLCPHCRRVGTLASHGTSIACASCGPLAELDPYYALQPPPPRSTPAEQPPPTASPTAATAEHTAAEQPPPTASPTAEHTAAEQPPPTATTAPFADLAAWNAWQQRYWQAHIEQQQAMAGSNRATTSSSRHLESLLLPEERAMVKIGRRQKTLRSIGLLGISLNVSGAVCYRAIDDRAQRAISAWQEATMNGGIAVHLVTEIEGCTVQNGELLEYYRNGILYQVNICTPRRNAYKWMITLRYLAEATKTGER